MNDSRMHFFRYSECFAVLNLTTPFCLFWGYMAIQSLNTVRFFSQLQKLG